jgi:predicted Zn-dependent protease
MKVVRKIAVHCAVLIVISWFLFPIGASGITIQKEEELSREFLKVVLKHFELIKDPLIVSYVNRIGQEIVSIVPHRYYKYRFYVVKEHTFNAFAGPGGHIFINSGLLEVMEDEGELAGILGHEIAHVECRHISQRIERASKIQLGAIAGLIAGVLLGSSAVVVGSMAAGQSLSLAYSREDETQADQIGLMYLSKAGYSGKGLLTSLKKMRSQQWFGEKEFPTYLRTHPASEDRMAYIDAWLDKNEKTEKVLSKSQRNDFQMAHMRLSALYGDKDIVLKKFESQVNKFPEDPLLHYGYGLALARVGNRKDAEIHLKIALEKKAFDPYILKDLGEIYYRDGRYPEAMNALEGALGTGSDDPDALFYLGRTQSDLGRFKDAVSSYEKLIENYRYYDQAFYFLAEAYGKQGELGKAHYYLGKHYIKQRNLKNSTFHLNRALKHTSDPEQRQKIEKLLEKLQKKPKRTPKDDDKQPTEE